MLQLLIAIAAFTVLALVAAPLWVRARRAPSLPAATYLEQKTMALAEETWREYRIKVPDFAAQSRDAEFVGRHLAAFTVFFQSLIEQGFDSEVKIWLAHLARQHDDGAARRLILSAALAFECRDGRHAGQPEFAGQAMCIALEKLS